MHVVLPYRFLFLLMSLGETGMFEVTLKEANKQIPVILRHIKAPFWSIVNFLQGKFAHCLVFLRGQKHLKRQNINLVICCQTMKNR